MSTNFKKQAVQQRAAVPQVDLETMKPPTLTPPTPDEVKEKQQSVQSQSFSKPETKPEPQISQATAVDRPKLTIVDTGESKVNRGFFMYPARHRQVTRDLAYIEDRKPHEIIEDALEEYVVKHYGKEFKRI